MTEQSTSSGIRTDMVDSAVRFMSTPKVRQTPLEDQKKFLANKGLTPPEIDAAVHRVQAEFGAVTPVVQAQSVPQLPARPTWTEYANMAVFCGGATYTVYTICRKWILPKFFNVPDPSLEQITRVEEQVNELQNSIKFVMDSVQQTLNAVQQQQESLNRALVLLAQKDSGAQSTEQSRQIQELKTELAVIKSLLLSRNQFAPLPNEVPSLPSWQLQSTQTAVIQSSVPSSAALSNGYATPNGYANGTHSDLDDTMSENGQDVKIINEERSTPV